MITKIQPTFERVKNAQINLDGIIGERISANLHNWLLIAPESNPAMLEMFRNREVIRSGDERLLPWSGEFAGKYLISAVQSLRLTRDDHLKNYLSKFVAYLSSVQDSDGYLGPFNKSERLTGKGLWDIWGHYHCMLGLLMWHEEVGDTEALKTCLKAADFLCQSFYQGGLRVVDSGSEEMNQAIIHIMCLLYEFTGKPQYMSFVNGILQDWQTPPSGDYLNSALNGKEFYQGPKPRWESLPDLQGLAELYFITGEMKYQQAFKHHWDSICNFDRHNTGGFSSGEQATGNPYDPGAIETCCTIAWMALCLDMLRLTGRSTAADELELSTYNAVLGSQNSSGRWWTYNTPMDGIRLASAHHIVFQARAGSPELNCCSVNAPRGLGILSEWAAMVCDGGIVLNYYGPSSFIIPIEENGSVEITQETDYPINNRVQIKINPDQPRDFSLKLRIPQWSKTTHLNLNGQIISDILPGTYCEIKRLWHAGDVVTIDFDFALRFWKGDKDCKGKTSIYRGPILLAYDERFNLGGIQSIPVIDLNKGVEKIENSSKSQPQPLILLKFFDGQMKEVVLCDFATAGMTGLHYVTWLQI